MLKTICVVSDKAFISGGQAKIAIDTACLLAGAGYRTIFFAPVGPVDPSLEEAGVEVHCLGQADILSNTSRLNALMSGLWNHKAAQALSALLDKLDPATSIVHCHGYAKALSPSIGPILARSGVPCLFTMHEYFLACPNGGFYDYRRNEICERHALGFSCLTTNCDARHFSHKVWRVARQALSWGPGQLPSGLTDIAYLSRRQLKTMQEYLSPTAHLHHLPNPVQQPSAEALADPRSSSVFLYVGRLSPEKGGMNFATAARIAGVEAVVVGDGEQRSAIERENPDIKILGWRTPTVVREFMTKARSLVFPSLWYETFGLVAYEAIQAGLPVICGKWNAAAEAVTHGVNGLILDSMEPENLATAMSQLKQDDHSVFDGIALPGNRRVPSDSEYLQRLLEIYSGMHARRATS